MVQAQRVSSSEAYLVATDTRILAVVPTECEMANRIEYLPGNALRRGATTAIEGNVATVRRPYPHNNECKCIDIPQDDDRRFPRITDALPKGDLSEYQQLTFDVRLLQRLFLAISEDSKAEKQAVTLLMKFNEDSCCQDPIVVLPGAEDPAVSFGLIMPLAENDKTPHRGGIASARVNRFVKSTSEKAKTPAPEPPPEPPKEKRNFAFHIS
jgi:hypothetical protein